MTIVIDEPLFRAADPLPRCTYCGSLARPNILMFGDYGWVDDRTSFQENRFEAWLQGLRENSKLTIVELGAGMAVPTVRYTSERIATHYGATLIRINPREYGVPQAGIGLPCSAAEGIAKLMKLVSGS